MKNVSDLELKKSSKSGVYEMPKKKDKRHSRRARWASRWYRRMVMALVLLAVATGWIGYVSHTSVSGTAGWMRVGTPSFDLLCGGKTEPYNPLKVGLFVNNPAMPCGAQVLATNRDNGKKLVLPVIHTDMVAYRGHAGDFTLSAAVALGIDPYGDGLAHVTLTPLTGFGAGLKSWTPVFSPMVEAPIKPADAHVRALASAMMGEAGHLFGTHDREEGTVAPAEGAMNRALIGHKGRFDVRSVVLDGAGKKTSCQFSPFCNGKNPPKPTKRSLEVARQMLDGTLPGKERWVLHALRDVTHFWAPLPMQKAPYWKVDVACLNQLPAGWEHFFCVPRNPKIREKLRVARTGPIPIPVPMAKPAAPQQQDHGYDNMDQLLAAVN